MKRRSNRKGYEDRVHAQNPKTGQIVDLTRKAFNSVYVDKGFELIETAEDLRPEPPTKAERLKRSENGSAITSSAADLAKALQIDKTPDEIPLKTKTAAAANAAEDVTENEDDFDANKSATEPRKPAGRDRGRTGSINGGA